MLVVVDCYVTKPSTRTPDNGSGGFMLIEIFLGTHATAINKFTFHCLYIFLVGNVFIYFLATSPARDVASSRKFGITT